MNDVVFQKTNGGLGRTLPGKDQISGMLFYTPNATVLPAGFGTNKVKQILSLADAEAKGITSISADYKVLNYHISEFFRISPASTLYVMIAAAPATGSIDFAELHDLINFSTATIRQVGIYNVEAAFATADVNTIQAVGDALAAEHKPFSILYQPDFSAVADLTALNDLHTLTAPNVSVLIGQDGAGTGAALFTAVGKTIGVLGAALAAVSLANVSESIAWPKKFKPVTGTELDEPAFAEGSNLSALAQAAIQGVNDKGYIFLVKLIGLSGSYFNDSFTCVALTDDFAYIENNRTIDKAIRGIRTYLLPELNGPLQLDPSTNKLSIDTIQYYQTRASKPLEQMQADGDVSGFDIYIDPAQDVVGTNTLTVKVTLVIKGVARTINVQIGLGK